MKIKVQWPESLTEYSVPDEQARGALDYAIRNNKEFWELVRDVAGCYQAELLIAELKRRKSSGKRRMMS